MKSFFFLLAALFFSVQLMAGEAVTIAGLKTLNLDYSTYAGQHVKISNKSNREIGVAAIDRETGKQVKGFGLNKGSNATMFIDEGLILTLKNTGMNEAIVKLDIVSVPKTPKKPDNTASITFTMRNSSAKSIPLIIPGVMNPNLSPFSNSGVNLKIGQKVFFKHKGKREVLFVVDDSIKNGDKVDIAAKVKARKAELN